MNEFGPRPQGTEGWKAPEDKPNKKAKITRRGALGTLIGGGLYAVSQLRKSPEKTSPARKEKNEPTLSIESLEKEFQLTPEELDMVKDLSQDIPLSSVRDIVKLEHSVKSPEERKERLKNPPEFKARNMEMLGMNSQALAELVKHRLPKGLFHSLKYVEYTDVELPMPTEYGKNMGKIEGAHAETTFNKIVFTKGSKPEGKFPAPYQIIKILRHEVGHFFDPTASPILTRQERLQLKKDLLVRIKSNEHMFSEYVTNINNTNRKQELDGKTKEYLAEIVDRYLSQHIDSSFTPDDEKIVKEIFAKLDPGFNTKKAAELESKVLEKWNDAYFKQSKPPK